jgi:hypothetical protein
MDVQSAFALLQYFVLLCSALFAGHGTMCLPLLYVFSAISVWQWQ